MQPFNAKLSLRLDRATIAAENGSGLWRLVKLLQYLVEDVKGM